MTNLNSQKNYTKDNNYISRDMKKKIFLMLLSMTYARQKSCTFHCSKQNKMMYRVICAGKKSQQKILLLLTSSLVLQWKWKKKTKQKSDKEDGCHEGILPGRCWIVWPTSECLGPCPTLHLFLVGLEIKWLLNLDWVEAILLDRWRWRRRSRRS